MGTDRRDGGTRILAFASLLGMRTLQFVALAIVMTIAFAVAPLISGVVAQPAGAQPSGPAPAAEPSSSILLLLLLVCALGAAVLGYLILESTWRGWKLIGAIFIAFYGSNTVVAQMESLVYLGTKLPAGMIPRLFMMGFLLAAVFSPLDVVILGKARTKTATEAAPRDSEAPWGASEWIWKLGVIAVGYLILYYGFGYFVAWKHPAVREFYGGTDPGSFFAQMAWIWDTTPWMFPFQILRALLWTLFVLPVIRMLEGSVWKVGLSTAFLFAVWSSQLLLPNPFMPEAVAHTHFVETVMSNFLFGFLVGSLLARPHAVSRRELATAPA